LPLWAKIWANQPIHSFLVGCLNPCLQGTSVWVGLPQPWANPFEHALYYCDGHVATSAWKVFGHSRSRS
jgi:hypothetical protein